MVTVSSTSKPSMERLGLISKIARMYHEQGLRQPDIAERLGLSQSRVSRLLAEAVGLGIVRTIVVPVQGLHSEMEEEIARRYGLTNVIVVDPVARDDASVLSAIGAAGAAFLETSIGPDDRVGISSWSSTLVAAVDVMQQRTTRGAASVVQMIGGVGDPNAQIQATHLVARLAELTGGTAGYLTAPGLVGSGPVRDLLLADPYIAATADQWDSLTVALVGVGSLTPSPLLMASGNAVSPHLQDELRELGAVGDVCLRFFDTQGRLVDSPIAERIVGISERAFRRIPRKVAMAGGDQKRSAIRAAALGGWIDVLITDVGVGAFLLETAAS